MLPVLGGLCTLFPVNIPKAYRTVFEIKEKGFDWSFPTVGLGFVLLGIVLIWVGKRYRWPLRRKVVGYFMVVFASLWFIGVFTTTHSGYSSLQSAYRRGQFSIVEGIVEDFKPMPYEGHSQECFSVDLERFCYSDFEITAGFNNTRSHGGPIREGVPVRVFYIGDTIVRLDVADDALTSDAQRRQDEQAAQADWQRRIQHDPTFNRMNLGFAIAAVFMTAWWNIQWLRFMRFWIKPPYRRLTIRLFRVFFGLNLIGALVYLISEISRSPLNPSGYLKVLETGAAMIIVVWIMVHAVEWVNRKQSPSH